MGFQCFGLFMREDGISLELFVCSGQDRLPHPHAWYGALKPKIAPRIRAAIRSVPRLDALPLRFHKHWKKLTESDP